MKDVLRPERDKSVARLTDFVASVGYSEWTIDGKCFDTVTAIDR